MYTMEEKVTAGGMVLDMEKPGWYRKIDLDTLTIRSCTDCVLGQVFNGFDTGKKELGISIGADYGFALNTAQATPYETRMEWNKLKELWIEEVEMRLVAEESASLDDAVLAIA